MAEKDTFSVRYDYDDMLGPMEPPLMDQMRKKVVDAVARGEVVRIVSGGETIGFMTPAGWFPPEMGFQFKPKP